MRFTCTWLAALSKLPVRQESFQRFHLPRRIISKLPVRQESSGIEWTADFDFSKLPVRQESI